MGVETFSLYLSQYSESKPLIFLPPNIALQSASTFLSHYYSFSLSLLRIFKSHQHEFYLSVYLLKKGRSENVGDLSVVSVRIEIA